MSSPCLQRVLSLHFAPRLDLVDSSVFSSLAKVRVRSIWWRRCYLVWIDVLVECFPTGSPFRLPLVDVRRVPRTFALARLRSFLEMWSDPSLVFRRHCRSRYLFPAPFFTFSVSISLSTTASSRTTFFLDKPILSCVQCTPILCKLPSFSHGVIVLCDLLYRSSSPIGCEGILYRLSLAPQQLEAAGCILLPSSAGELLSSQSLSR